MEGGGRKVRKTVNGAAAYGHGDRRGFYATADEVRSVFERGEFVALFLVERPDSRSPELNLDGGHLSSPHTQGALAVIRQENKFSLLSGRSNEKCYRESNSPDSVFLKVMNIKKLKITLFQMFLW
jgi:hypothetical protein